MRPARHRGALAPLVASLAPALLAASLAGCAVDVEGAACATPGSTVGCPGGQACGTGGTCSKAAAACSPCTPGALACRDGDVKACTAEGDPVCGSWTTVDACGAAGLVCAADAAPACACPAHLESPVVLWADPAAPTVSGLVRNGAETPACRFLSLGAALAAAPAGASVRAAGWAGAPVVFTEGPLAVPDGVALLTDDAAPDPGHYVVEPSAAVGASDLVALRPGSSLAGFTLRNVGATGAAIATACAAAGDTALVSVASVRVAGLGAGDPPARFLHGLRHGGACSLSLSGSTLEGAADGGVLVSDAAPGSALTLTGNLVQRNEAATPYAIGAGDRLGGGLVFYGAHPGTVTLRANRFLANAGDQVLVFSPGTIDLSVPACGADENVLACYAAGGVGLSTRFGTVNVAHAAWQNDLPAAGVDFVAATGATIVGAATQSCGAYAGGCPAP